MAALSSVPPWEIPWAEEPGGLQSRGSEMTEHTHNGRFTLLLVLGAQRRRRQTHSGPIHCFFVSESPSTHISVWHPPMLHSGFLSCHLLQEGFPDHRRSKESLFFTLYAARFLFTALPDVALYIHLSAYLFSPSAPELKIC